MDLWDRGEPVWCHDCGTYSFAPDWDDSEFGCGDVCPVCGSIFPAMGGPLAELPELAEAAASTRAVVW